MAKMIHSMIRVSDESRSVAFYENAFGLKVAGRYPFDGFTLIYLSNEETGFELELTTNASRTEPYEHGDAYGHLAFSVEDIEAEHQRLGALGIEVGAVKDFEFEGKPFARFFFLQDPDGYKIEVLQRSGRFQ
ncbi:lactoylglutathione lyase [Roseibium denhamense]|uniref:Aldoketomutase n=1 Tax=Roseibium denhamense TaxID=76305 RepID=A0ABY1P4R6_9HYPH|nr:VOC family protein [Roseibium denhamense]MTI07233.1 lactoylglutathione lyase [Roseibium denhamense]SMP26358.1 lactoylglutathione lyase [Roseibium denhamense]